MKNFFRSICLAAALASVQTVWCQDEDPVKTRIIKTDGSILELPYLRFDIADGTAIFAGEDGKEFLVPATEISLGSLGLLSGKMPPVAAWLDPTKSYLCVRPAGAEDQKHEEEAAYSILDAAKQATSLKERIALLQLYGIVHGLLKADRDRVRMEVEVADSRKLMGLEHKKDLHYADRHAVNPLTGRDQKTPHMEWSKEKTEPVLQQCIEREQASKRELMLRLASCNIFSRYCEISGREAYAKELDQLRIKVANRSPVARDSEAAGLAILSWMASRVSVHHHTGNNAALLKGMFAKMQTEAQVDAGIRAILFHRPPEEAFKTRAVLLAFTGNKLMQSQIGDRILDIRLRDAFRELIPDLDQRKKVIGQLRPFMEAAIRMGSG